MTWRNLGPVWFVLRLYPFSIFCTHFLYSNFVLIFCFQLSFCLASFLLCLPLNLFIFFFNHQRIQTLLAVITLFTPAKNYLSPTNQPQSKQILPKKNNIQPSIQDQISVNSTPKQILVNSPLNTSNPTSYMP